MRLLSGLLLLIIVLSVLAVLVLALIPPAALHDALTIPPAAKGKGKAPAAGAQTGAATPRPARETAVTQPPPARASRSRNIPQGLLLRIARCESSLDPHALSPDGTYRGLFQFDQATWQSVGGTGDPAQASVAEQWLRAELLIAKRGTEPWPQCGKEEVQP